MKTKTSAARLAGALLALPLLLSLAGCLVPDNAYLMELNRNGKWREAERVGLAMLDNRDKFTHSQTLETYFHVIYAKTRQGKIKEAVSCMEQYDEFGKGQPLDGSVRWLTAEIFKLKEELGMLTPVQSILVRALEENGKKNYPRAIELCREALERSDAAEKQKAVAELVSAICYIRLEDLAQAEKHMAAFEKSKNALSADDQTLQEAAFARRGLAELKAKKAK
jgi:tetratricopeptide (TPR) repeat protein